MYQIRKMSVVSSTSQSLKYKPTLAPLAIEEISELFEDSPSSPVAPFAYPPEGHSPTLAGKNLAAGDDQKYFDEIIQYVGPCHLLPPPRTPCWELPPTRKHTFFLNKDISLIREYYMNVYT